MEESVDKSTQSARQKQARETVRRLGIEDAYPFENRFLVTPMGAMHYVDEGTGHPVLMLHGNPTWSFLYRNFISEISKEHRVISPDHIGFGLSDKPSVEADYSLENHVANLQQLVISLDLSNITLVVQDWGGPIGLTVAARNPERFRAIVLMNTFGFYPPVEGADPESLKLPLPLRTMRSPGLGDFLVRRVGMFERIAMPTAVASKHAWKEVRNAYRDVFQGPRDRGGVMAFPRL
ncbi:MAG: alpha/beta fold hydrolase, partial [Planctomycetota bacterium]